MSLLKQASRGRHWVLPPSRRVLLLHPKASVRRLLESAREFLRIGAESLNEHSDGVDFHFGTARP